MDCVTMCNCEDNTMTVYDDCEKCSIHVCPTCSEISIIKYDNNKIFKFDLKDESFVEDVWV